MVFIDFMHETRETTQAMHELTPLARGGYYTECNLYKYCSTRILGRDL